MTIRRLLLAAAVLVPVAAACGADDSDGPTTLTLLAYDSFVLPDDAFDAFTAATGVEVEVAIGGDAGELVSKAALTAGNPEGDVLWGVDNTLLSRALDAEVFEPYTSTRLGELRDELVGLVPGREVTPVDFGDVCVNYDVAALEQWGLEPPQDFDDLVAPEYRDLLVVPSPATSSPGLAFLLATVAEYGETGWQDWWRDLRANGVLVVDGWSQAYYEEFTRAGGDRPLVVSYGSSPPAEVLFADPPLPDGAPAPTGVVPTTCFRQVEFAGVLRGTEHPEAARQLVDYLVSDEFQALLPEHLFVYPANRLVELPPTFERYAVVPDEALTLDPSRIAANRQAWVDEWTTIVLR